MTQLLDNAVGEQLATRTIVQPTARPHQLFRGGLFLIIPAIVLEVGILFLPLVYILYRSFFEWQPAEVSTFTGFDNYALLFSDPEFWQIVGNQLFYLLGLPLYIAAPICVAFLLRERVKFAGLWRSIYFLPAVMSPAIVGLVFRSLLSTDGPVNAFLTNVGLEAFAQPWLTDADLVKPVVVVLILWAGFGTGVLIFGSAFSAVSPSIFEAARLDGAGWWRELVSVAIPNVRPTVVLWTMFQIASIFLFMFGWIYVLTGGGPGIASATMDFSIYQEFMRFGFYGTAAAQSVVLVIAIVLVPALIGLVRVIARAVSGAGSTRRAAR